VPSPHIEEVTLVEKALITLPHTHLSYRMPLSYARYGKANVRLLKVRKDPSNPEKQDVIELRVRCLLEGDIETSYTKADNSVIVPTDTVKQTTYILAKKGEVWPIELFAARLANHFITTYGHIHGAHVDIQQYRWTRYNVQGKPHPHSFIQDGTEQRTVNLVKRENTPFEITSGIKGLTVLKSTGSMFYDFNVDDYTILQPTKDRILSTDVDTTWHWTKTGVPDLKTVTKLATNGVFDEVYNKARNQTLETFALENSASVQATMYNISNQLLAAAPGIDRVSFALPNKHYFNIDLSWHHGLKNTGKDAEVFAPQSDPNGHIESVVSRDTAKL